MTLNIQEIVLKFFKSKGNIPGNSIEDYLSCNYLDIGLLDSMQLVEMIVLLEDEIKIKFTTDDLQSNEFRTIGGLMNIIKQRLNDNKN